MPGYDPVKYVDMQRQDWNQAAGAWEKWDRWFDENMDNLNHQLILRARLDAGYCSLDLGSGTGYPAIISAMKVGDGGKVIGLDLAEDMLAVARRKSVALGLGNIMFQVCDVREIPFEDNKFDAVTSRFCLMFLPFLIDTLKETHRTLRPGGKMAAAVWSGPEKNPGLTLAVTVMKEFIDIPQPDPSMPGLFALAEPGKLKVAMQAAGYENVNENEEGLTWSYTSGAEFVESFREIAAPLKPLFEALEVKDQAEMELKLANKAEEYRDGDTLKIPGVVNIADGEKVG